MPEKPPSSTPGINLLDALEEVAPAPASQPRPRADRKVLESMAAGQGFPSREPRAAPPAPPVVVTRGRKFRASGRNYRFSVKLRPADAQFIYDVAEAEQLLIAEVIEEGLAVVRARRDGQEPKTGNEG